MKFLSSFICLQLLSSLCLFGKVVEIQTLSQYEQEVGTVDENTLVLFDIDETLVMPKDAILGPKGRPFAHTLIKQYLNDSKTLDEYWGIVLAGTEFDLVEKQCVSLIQDFQNKNIPVMGLTFVHPGKIGHIESFATFRLNLLKGFDIDLSPTISQTTYLELDGPVYQSGVIFTAKQDKGQTLKRFLEEFDLKPKKIVFFDDTLKQIESVEQAAKELGIEYIGLHYTAALNAPYVFDEKLGEFQYRYLAEHGVWLRDDEAKKLMEAF